MGDNKVLSWVLCKFPELVGESGVVELLPQRFLVDRSLLRTSFVETPFIAESLAP